MDEGAHLHTRAEVKRMVTVPPVVRRVTGATTRFSNLGRPIPVISCGHVMQDALVREVRAAVRFLAIQPGWSTAALLCVAIATGASTAAFALVNGVLLRPVPFEEPDRLVMVALREPDQPTTHPFALRDFRDLAAASTSTVALLARTFLPSSLAAGDGTRMVQAEFVSGNYFDVLRLTPQRGRFFEERDDHPGGPIEVVLSDRLWRTRFAGNPAVVGSAMRVNGRAVTVAGVAPTNFAGAMRLVHADLWVPAATYAEMSRTTDADAVPIFGVMGRLTEGTTHQEAADRLSAALAAGSRPGAAQSMVVVTAATGFGVPPAARPAVTGLSTVASVLMGLLIAVACANVAALMLARAVGRRPDLAIRISLGASRWQVASWRAPSSHCWAQRLGPS